VKESLLRTEKKEGSNHYPVEKSFSLKERREEYYPGAKKSPFPCFLLTERNGIFRLPVLKNHYDNQRILLSKTTQTG
jgi:hypothetical protein